MNLPQVSLEFHVLFENLFICRFLEEYLSCLCCVKAVSVEYKHIRFSFFQLAFNLHSLFFSFFFFLCKQDSYGVKVAFVSSYLENPLSRTSYFSTMFNSKHKICCLSLSWMTKQFFNIGITISTRLTRSMKKDFSRKYQL